MGSVIVTDQSFLTGGLGNVSWGRCGGQSSLPEAAVVDINWGRVALGRVAVTGESCPLSPVLGLTREQLVQSLEFT